MKKPLIVLTGPTAVGKQAFHCTCKAVNGEIISADSMQVYRHMDIGSAKITPEEWMASHIIWWMYWSQQKILTLSFFQQMAKDAMDKIYDKGRIPILVGGTGFYIQSVTRDIDFTSSDQDEHYRRELEELAEQKGPAFLHDMLAKVDPKSAEDIHENNVKRVIRALEFYKQNGTRISEHNEEQKEHTSPYALAYFVLNAPRPLLYERIDTRVDEMLKNGLTEEVKKLREMGCHRGMVSMQGLGYKEILDWMGGNYSYEEAVRVLKRDTRHFAKRQLTWFRREGEVTWVDKDNFDYDDSRILSYMLSVCREKGSCLPNKIKGK